MEEAALQLPDEQLDRDLGAAYGIFSGEHVRTAELRFTPEMARWVSQEKWHRLQEGSFGADGSYTLKFPYSAEREVVMDIMRFGPEARSPRSSGTPRERVNRPQEGSFRLFLRN